MTAVAPDAGPAPEPLTSFPDASQQHDRGIHAMGPGQLWNSRCVLAVTGAHSERTGTRKQSRDAKPGRQARAQCQGSANRR